MRIGSCRRSGALYHRRTFEKRVCALPQSMPRPMAHTSLKWSMIEEDLSIGDKFRLIADLGFDGI